MHMNGERDFVGYGKHPPDPRWPGHARLALNFVVNVEEGGEPSVPDGAARSESALTELGSQPSDVQGRDLAAESMFEYGSRVAVWRVLDLFASAGMPCTIFACAEALRRNPALCTEIGERGYDVCAHGFLWAKHYELDEEIERRHIRAAVESIRDSIGSSMSYRNPPSSTSRRQSIGYFLHPNFDARVACLPACQDRGNPPKYAPITAGERMREKLLRRVEA